MTATAVSTLRVFLCDDTPELRKRVRVAFGSEPGLRVIGEADDPVDGLPLIEELQPDVVVLDLSMPRMDGLEAIAHIAHCAPDAAVVVFSGFLSEVMAGKALALGADRYVEKSAPLGELAAAVREAVRARAAGERPVVPVPAVAEPAAPREPEPPAADAARAADLDVARLPGHQLSTAALAAASGAALGCGVAISGLAGVANDLLLVLFLAPAVLLGARCGRGLGLVLALVCGGFYGLSAELSHDGDPLQAVAGVALAASVLVLATQWARDWVVERAEHQAALLRELRRANRELDQFASVASHDLAAPLRTITGFAGLLQRRYAGQLDEQADEFLGHVTAGTERMRRTIDDLLAFARAGHVDAADAPFPLARALADTESNLAAEISERGAVIRHRHLPDVWGDERRVVQVLQNLVANGIKFCPPDRVPLIDVTAARTPTGWRVEVRDNGIGIDPRHASRVFGMFQRLVAQDEYPGTGIGLAICQRIVERHGGRIWVDSPDSGGTVVAFTLPDRV